MDIELHYIEKGHGMPLVLLHGNGESCEYFEHQVDFFSEFYRVIAVDTRGHGKSLRGSAPFTIEQFADDLNEFFEKMKIEKAIVLGFSDGANIAMRFALKYQEKLLALILNGGNLEPSGMKLMVQLPIEVEYWFLSKFAGLSNRAKMRAELLGLMVNDPYINKKELFNICVPALVIAGTNDMIRDSHTRQIAQSIPGAELAFVRGDHFIAQKEHDAFNGKVAEFLRRSV